MAAGLVELSVVGGHLSLGDAATCATPSISGMQETGASTTGTSYSDTQILGCGFTGATSIQFGTASETTGFQVVNDGYIDVTSFPPHPVGTVDTTVTTPAGTSPKNPNDQFVYYDRSNRFSAEIDTTNFPATWAQGVAQTFSVRIANTGDETLPQPCTGCTWVAALDMHFASSAGGSANMNNWSTSTAFEIPFPRKEESGRVRTRT